MQFLEPRNIEELNKYKKVILFGAGSTCSKTIQFVEEHFPDLEIIGVYDSDFRKVGLKIDDKYIVKNLDTIFEFNVEQTAVLLSTISNQFEIANQLLTKYFFPERNLFSNITEFSYKYMYGSSDILNNKGRIENARLLLEDYDSKEYYENIINSKLNCNPLFLKQNQNIKSPYEYGDVVTLNKGDSIVDCGAFTGDTTEYFINKLEKQCFIYSIEPFLGNFEELIKSVKNNHYNDIVECFNYAVGDQVTSLEIYSDSNISDQANCRGGGGISIM